MQASNTRRTAGHDSARQNNSPSSRATTRSTTSARTRSSPATPWARSELLGSRRPRRLQCYRQHQHAVAQRHDAPASAIFLVTGLGGFNATDSTNMLLRSGTTAGFGNCSSRGTSDMSCATQIPAGWRSTASIAIKSPAPRLWAGSDWIGRCWRLAISGAGRGQPTWSCAIPTTAGW
jgi:hypothetical protein